jgi:hypothetical protein
MRSRCGVGTPRNSVADAFFIGTLFDCTAQRDIQLAIMQGMPRRMVERGGSKNITSVALVIGIEYPN